MHLSTGQTFADDFRVISPLGEGGMGAVYEVEQLSTGKRRALKVMRAVDPRAWTDTARRFVLEARITASIKSEHVVDVIAAGVDAQSGVPWLAMELLDGDPLDKLVEREGRLPARDVLEICRQLFHAVAAAHDVPLIHRDLKPENIFIAGSRVPDQKPLVKVLDFGIAKLLSDGSRTTGAMGTPLWMAPEQTVARTTLTPQADVWALGLIVFQLLTGEYYWLAVQSPDASPAALLREIVVDPLEGASARARALGTNIPIYGFDEWFGKCVTRDLGQRFPNARVAWEALAPILDPATDPRVSAARGNLETQATFDEEPELPRAAASTAHLLSGPAFGESQGFPSDSHRDPAPFGPRTPTRSNVAAVVGLIALTLVVGAVVLFAGRDLLARRRTVSPLLATAATPVEPAGVDAIPGQADTTSVATPPARPTPASAATAMATAPGSSASGRSASSKRAPPAKPVSSEEAAFNPFSGPRR